MKIQKLFTTPAAAAGIAMVLGTTSAHAANTFFAPGDLVLYFQQEGSSNTVYANLGNAAAILRGDTAGPGIAPSLNIVNLNSTLSSAFGPGWASSTSLYMGAAAVWGANSTNTSLKDGDPHRTLYVSQARSTLGDIFTQNTPGIGVGGNSFMTIAANDIYTMNQAFENNYDAQVVISTVDVSLIDDFNPFAAAGIQGTAYEYFEGGVQQAGSAGNLGSLDDLGLGSIEFALDMYRILGKNNIAGQVGGPLREGTFEGTIVLGSNGSVSVIPEPSAVTLAGLAGLSLVFRRRRA